MELSTLKIDKESAENGRWLDLDDSGAKIKLCRIGNAKYRERLKFHTQKFRSPKSVSDEAYVDMLNMVLAETVVKDWKGLTDDGQEILYSYEKCLELFRNPAYVEFKNIVVRLADSLDNFRMEVLNEDVGESSVS